MRKREELGKEEEGRNLESKGGRERAGGIWKDCAGEKEVCQELGREKK